MSSHDHPSLSLALEKLVSSEPQNYAIWVLKAPYPGGYVHHDCNWDARLTDAWCSWQEMFSSSFDRNLCPQLTVSGGKSGGLSLEDLPPSNHSTRLMQHLGLVMWQWLFSGAIDTAFAHSQGIAGGKTRPLRLRLDIRDPNLIAFPWEILQPQPGKPAVSLNQQLLFSRTSSDVDRLPPQRNDRSIKILLVLGGEALEGHNLSLDREAAAIAEVLRNTYASGFAPTDRVPPASCQVDVLTQPSHGKLIDTLDAGSYNLFFYAGHGMPGADGGLLFLRSGASINGTELAQVLVRNQVKLAVFNSCWGAQPYQEDQQSVPRSSMAEVLLHHGVPAILAMRDTIADHEAISFIQAFTQSLALRLSVDESMVAARQHLLTLYKFNQPAWTLPVLYMHPEYDGELLKPVTEAVTEMPYLLNSIPAACLRSLVTATQNFPIQGGLMRVGRSGDNDLIISEPWVSQKHAEVIYRNSSADESPGYFLRDFSRYGTLVQTNQGWQKIHHQELPLKPGMQLKFGSDQGQSLEFSIDLPNTFP
jgi:CHAT domain/FHA domain